MINAIGKNTSRLGFAFGRNKGNNDGLAMKLELFYLLGLSFKHCRASIPALGTLLQMSHIDYLGNIMRSIGKDISASRKMLTTDWLHLYITEVLINLNPGPLAEEAKANTLRQCNQLYRNHLQKSDFAPMMLALKKMALKFQKDNTTAAMIYEKIFLPTLLIPFKPESQQTPHHRKFNENFVSLAVTLTLLRIDIVQDFDQIIPAQLLIFIISFLLSYIIELGKLINYQHGSLTIPHVAVKIILFLTSLEMKKSFKLTTITLRNSESILSPQGPSSGEESHSHSETSSSQALPRENNSSGDMGNAKENAISGAASREFKDDSILIISFIVIRICLLYSSDYITTYLPGLWGRLASQIQEIFRSLPVNARSAEVIWSFLQFLVQTKSPLTILMRTFIMEECQRTKKRIVLSMMGPRTAKPPLNSTASRSNEASSSVVHSAQKLPSKSTATKNTILDFDAIRNALDFPRRGSNDSSFLPTLSRRTMKRAGTSTNQPVHTDSMDSISATPARPANDPVTRTAPTPNMPPRTVDSLGRSSPQGESPQHRRILANQKLDASPNSRLGSRQSLHSAVGSQASISSPPVMLGSDGVGGSPMTPRRARQSLANVLNENMQTFRNRMSTATSTLMRSPTNQAGSKSTATESGLRYASSSYSGTTEEEPPMQFTDTLIAKVKYVLGAWKENGFASTLLENSGMWSEQLLAMDHTPDDLRKGAIFAQQLQQVQQFKVEMNGSDDKREPDALEKFVNNLMVKARR